MLVVIFSAKSALPVVCSLENCTLVLTALLHSTAVDVETLKI